MLEESQRQIERNGFAILAAVFDPTTVASMRDQLAAALGQGEEQPGSIRVRAGAVYAARNVMDLFPGVERLWQVPRLLDLVQSVLGPESGLVRVMYFDKPPERSWTLPWHKDMTIAVRVLSSDRARRYKIQYKAGVPHVEAPLAVLESMLTLRLHLDDVMPENGPLKVVCGSHQTGKRLTLDDGPQQTILVKRGDVLAIRPLVSHCSARSAETTRRHRGVLHFEFSATSSLPDGLEWHGFLQPSSIRSES